MNDYNQQPIPSPSRIQTYTPKELASELGIPYRVVLEAIRNRKLRCIQYSPRVRHIRSEDASRWVTSITN